MKQNVPRKKGGESITFRSEIAFVFRLCSIEKVPKIKSPVLVIHGTEDEVIDISHGLEIHGRCQTTVEPLWVEGAGHNDVELYAQYLDRLKHLIDIELNS